jgi:hypothetical protein
MTRWYKENNKPYSDDALYYIIEPYYGEVTSHLNQKAKRYNCFYLTLSGVNYAEGVDLKFRQKDRGKLILTPYGPVRAEWRMALKFVFKGMKRDMHEQGLI